MTEADLHLQVAQYLRYRYPDVLWHTDMAGVRLTMSQARQAKAVQQGRAWPDIFVAQPKWHEWDEGHQEGPQYCGLFLELKREGTCVYKKNGELTADRHIREQAALLDRLRKRRYAAEFAVGFEEAKRIIDEYLQDL